ncbi:hypothetical protein PFISCL1PPCAC_15163, partial [Pristionchus fissidentatus]
FSDAYKILVYSPKFGHSHSNFMGQIADILVDAGHNVTTLIPIMDPHVADGTVKSHKIYVGSDPIVETEQRDMRTCIYFFISLLFFSLLLQLYDLFSTLIGRNCVKVLSEPGLIERLKEEKYDVFIVENFEVCGMGISTAIAPKSVISAASTCLYAFQFEEFGVPQSLSYRPTLFHSSLNVHSFYSRLINLIGELFIRVQFFGSRVACNRALKERFGPDYPTVAEQSSNIAYLFTNSEPLLESAAPTLSRVIDISQIGAKEPKPLDEYWNAILSRRPKTILLSLGSMVRSFLLPDKTKEGILKAFSRFPETTFIWKYERPEDEFCVKNASKVENIVMSKWLPQVDLLNDSRMIAFITHGGMGSAQETAASGVPGIFIPIFGDQARNSGMMAYNGFGIVFDKFELHDEDKLEEAIREVTENPKYRENVQRVASMLAAKPFKPREQLIKYVEFAAEFGPSPSLRPQSHDMNSIEYNNLDIIFISLVVLSISTFFSIKIIVVIFRKLFGVRKMKGE